jgi:coenzyme F420 hydrogenase subunit beta
MANNVASIVKEELCTGCGTCEGLCPVDAIKMEVDKKRGIYTPHLNGDKCTQCGTCFQVCPGHSVDFQQLSPPVGAGNKYDILIGNYHDCYSGYATNEDIRYRATSGGLVSQLLIFALNKGYIDGALVTRMRKNNPLEPEPFIARTTEEIIEASQSKYCPVPANVALKAILQSTGKFAVVGLPCHLHGIRKAEQIYPTLKENILLHLGLFCAHAPNFWGIRTYLNRSKVKPEEVSRLRYRGEGWPGGVEVSKNDGSHVSMPHQDFYRKYASDFFIPSRCLMCCDQTAELADLSFGDAWLPEYRSDKIGRSILISRSETGMQLLKQAVDLRAVELVRIEAKLVKYSQLDALYLKKYITKSYMRFSRNKPVFKTKLPEPRNLDHLLSFMLRIVHVYSIKSLSRLLLKHLPIELFTFSQRPYKHILEQQLKKFKQQIL